VGIALLAALMPVSSRRGYGSLAPARLPKRVDVTSNYSVTGEFIVDGCQCLPRTEVLLRDRLRAERPNAGRSISSKRRSGRVMRKTLVTLAVGATIAIGAVTSPTPADARWRHHHHHHHDFPIAPVVGGLAAGALIGAALASAQRPYYSYAYEPVYFGPTCRVRRERIWDGWRWRVRRVEDCY
jgi:hypothetical protein